MFFVKLVWSGAVDVEEDKKKVIYIIFVIRECVALLQSHWERRESVLAHRYVYVCVCWGRVKQIWLF